MSAIRPKSPNNDPPNGNNDQTRVEPSPNKKSIKESTFISTSSVVATKEFSKKDFSWKDVLLKTSSDKAAAVVFTSDEEETRSNPQTRSRSSSPNRHRDRRSPPSPVTNQQTSQSIAVKNEGVLQCVQNLSKDIQLMVLLCGIPGSGKSTIARRLVETSHEYYDVSYDDGILFEQQSEDNTLLRQQDYREDYLYLTNQQTPTSSATITTKATTADLSNTEIDPSSSAMNQQMNQLSNSVDKKLYFLREWITYTQDQFKSRKVMERYCYDAILKGYNIVIDRCNFDSEQRSHWIRMIYDYYLMHYQQQQHNYGFGRSYYPYGDISPPPSTYSYSSSFDRHTNHRSPDSYLNSYKNNDQPSSNPYAYEYYQTMIPSQATTPPPTTSTAASTESSFAISKPPQKPFYVLCVMVPNFDNYEVCVQRATARGDSDGLHDADTDWRRVCASMVQNFKYPSVEEAIDGIYHCRDEKDLDVLMETLLFGLREKETVPA